MKKGFTPEIIEQIEKTLGVSAYFDNYNCGWSFYLPTRRKKKLQFTLWSSLDELVVTTGSTRKYRGMITFPQISYLAFVPSEKKIIFEEFVGSRVNFIEISADGTFMMYTGFKKESYKPKWADSRV